MNKTVPKKCAKMCQKQTPKFIENTENNDKNHNFENACKSLKIAVFL